MEADIKRVINRKCSEQFEFVHGIEKVFNERILLNINKYIDCIEEKKDEKNLSYAITALTCQGIKTYKSCVLLIQEGYAINALVNLRSLVEIILTIDYILEDKSKKYKRALMYLNGEKSEAVWRKAKRSLNTTLYKSYEVLCQYTHMNYVAVDKNTSNGSISVSASDTLVEPTAIFVNGVLLYLLQIICKFYNINYEEVIDIEVPKSVKEQIEFYNKEKNAVDIVYKAIFEVALKGLGIKEEDIYSFKQEYKNYQIKKSIDEKKRGKKKNNKNKRKVQKKNRKMNKMR